MPYLLQRCKAMEQFLETALAAARSAAQVALEYYRGEFEVEVKSDQTPVTIADRKAEEIIRGTLLETCLLYTSDAADESSSV